MLNFSFEFSFQNFLSISFKFPFKLSFKFPLKLSFKLFPLRAPRRGHARGQRLEAKVRKTLRQSIKQHAKNIQNSKQNSDWFLNRFLAHFGGLGTPSGFVLVGLGSPRVWFWGGGYRWQYFFEGGVPMEVGGCHFWRSWRSFGAERWPKGCILEVKTELNEGQNLYKTLPKISAKNKPKFYAFWDWI